MKGCSTAVNMIRDSPSYQAAMIGATNRYSLQEADLNGNGIKDKFYVIDGNVAVVELDGKPVVKSLDSKVASK